MKGEGSSYFRIQNFSTSVPPSRGFAACLLSRQRCTRDTFSQQGITKFKGFLRQIAFSFLLSVSYTSSNRVCSLEGHTKCRIFTVLVPPQTHLYEHRAPASAGNPHAQSPPDTGNATYKQAVSTMTACVIPSSWV